MVQLRGADGELTATDSRQVLVQRGFRFPWAEELLIVGTSLFAARELLGHSLARIGRTAEFVTVQSGPWTIHLRIETTGRFPDVRRIIPAETVVGTRLQLTAEDAKFLAESLDGLPSESEFDHPVTLDLNGAVAIRGRSAPDAPVSELILSNSTRTGVELCLNTNRKYLARAVALGFREVQLVDPATPVVCRDERRTYLWALLEPDGVIPPAENALRTSSPQASNVSTPDSPRVNRIGGRLRKGSPAATAPSTRQPGGQKTASEDSQDVIGRALALRAVLRTVLHGLGDLVRQVRRERKQARLTKSTLAALKQLRTLDV
jgi:hypothetical protein